MQVFGGLGLLLALVICYLLYFNTLSAPADGSTSGNKPGTEVTAENSALSPAAPGSHDVYKSALDRAHTAAAQMQAPREDPAGK